MYRLSNRYVLSSSTDTASIADFGLGGTLPMLPYFFLEEAIYAVPYSCIIAGFILFVFGFIKGHLVDGNVRHMVYFAFETLLVGCIAATLSFLIIKGLSAHSRSRSSSA